MSDQTTKVLGKPKYVQSSFSLYLPNQVSVAELAARISEQLGSLYQPPEHLTVANEADAETPRLLFVSQHGFSQIVVSQVSVVLTVQYSPPWQKDITLGKSYLEERVTRLSQAFDSIMFVGMGTLVHFSVEDEERLVNALMQHHASGLSAGTPHEVILRLSSIIKDMFFRNISIRNFRTWSLAPYFRGPIRLSRENQTEQGLEVSLDFNDRHAYNEKVDYKSSPDMALTVLRLGFEELQQVVEGLEQETWL